MCRVCVKWLAGFCARHSVLVFAKTNSLRRHSCLACTMCVMHHGLEVVGYWFFDYVLQYWFFD